jgi:hypothetical protein
VTFSGWVVPGTVFAKRSAQASTASMMRVILTTAFNCARAGAFPQADSARPKVVILNLDDAGLGPDDVEVRAVGNDHVIRLDAVGEQVPRA